METTTSFFHAIVNGLFALGSSGAKVIIFTQGVRICLKKLRNAVGCYSGRMHAWLALAINGPFQDVYRTSEFNFHL